MSTPNMIKPTLTEDQKNDLVSQSKGIIYYMANRYRFFDDDFEELVGWAYLGLALAIHEYEADPTISLSTHAFTNIKKTFYQHYKRTKNSQKSISMQKTIFKGKDKGELTLEGLTEDTSGISLSEHEIRSLITKALGKANLVCKNIVIDFYVNGYSGCEIQKKYGVTKSVILRLTRQGKILIKNWLLDNDLISESLTNEENNNSHVEPKSYNLGIDVLQKIKYLTINFDFLDHNDLVTILKISPFEMKMLFDNPTTQYLLCVPDESIHNKAIAYCKDKYPERIASEVKKYTLKS